MEMVEKNTQEFHPLSANDISQGIVNKLETGNTKEPSCYRCGGKHAAPKCKFKSAKCYKCSKVGHIASVCRSQDVESSMKTRQPKAEGNIHSVLESNTEGCDDNDELGIYSVYAVGTDNPSNKGYTVEMTINGSPCAMALDTAADYSIMSKSTHSQKFSNFPLRPSKDEMKAYRVETLTVCGEMLCDIMYKGHEYMHCQLF